MPRLVGVFKAPPVYVVGLKRVLSSRGFALEAVTDPLSWVRRNRGAAVLVAVQDSRDLDVVIELKAEQPDSVVVTLIDKVDVDSFQSSLSAGAVGSIARDADATTVVLAFDAAMANNIVIPAHIARALAENRSSPHLGLDRSELGWLRGLATGETVAELSGRVGYSEREMYRRLRRLYTRMGASGRTDALLRATRQGWLD